MTFSHQDQIDFAKIALKLFDAEKSDAENLGKILEFGELIKKYAEEDNAVVYDITEYIYEQIRLLNQEDGAFDDTTLRQSIERDINSHY